MQLTHNRNESDYFIQSCTSTEIRIKDLSYSHSLIVSPTQIIKDWPPQTVQALESQHLDIIIALNPEIVLLGTGEQQHFLDPKLLVGLISRHIGFEVMHTTAACYTFNLLVSEGRRVVAGLMLSK